MVFDRRRFTRTNVTTGKEQGVHIQVRLIFQSNLQQCPLGLIEAFHFVMMVRWTTTPIPRPLLPAQSQSLERMTRSGIWRLRLIVTLERVLHIGSMPEQWA